MTTEITAESAIETIKSVKTNFMGLEVNKYNYPVQIRAELQKMAEKDQIKPSEYKRALDLTWPMMSGSEKASEHDLLS